MPLQRSPLRALCFPGEDSWETWIAEADGTWKLVERSARGAMGVEAIQFESAPFWSLNHQDAPDEAVALRWEGYGLQHENGASLWTHWPITRRTNQVLVGTLALTAESSTTSPGAFCADSFEPSTRLLPLPASGIVVWKELGRYVTAFTRNGALLHAINLTSRELDVDAAFEIRDWFAMLHANGFIGPIPAIHVWTRCETDFAPQLACLFEDAAVIKEARPEPRLPEQPSGLLPAHVAVMRKQQEIRKRRMTLMAVAATMYLCLFGAWWLRLQWRESGLDRADREMADMQPQIDLVSEAQSRWLEMEAAINPDLYPMELFHQIVSLLPAEGIRLKEFQIQDGRLIVSGEATTVNHALGFKDRLAACAPLRRYAWSFPVPAIRDDNRADFRAEGILNGEGANESQ